MDKFNEVYNRIIMESKNVTLMDDIIESGKFYKIEGDWNYNGTGFFGTMYGSFTDAFLDMFSDFSDNTIMNYFNMLRNLIKLGYGELYYKDGHAIIIIAGDLKNSNINFGEFDNVKPLIFSSDDIEEVEDYKKRIKEISEQEFKQIKFKCLNSLNKEEEILLNIDEDERAELFGEADIDPKF